MSEKGLGLLSGPEFARCPRCNEVIDASIDVCRFCGSFLDKTEREQAAAAHHSKTEAVARSNNRRALIAGLVGLFGTAFFYALWFLVRYLLRY